MGPSSILRVATSKKEPISFPSCASLPRCGDETQARGQQHKRDTMTEEKVEAAADAGPSPSKGTFVGKLLRLLQMFVIASQGELVLKMDMLNFIHEILFMFK